MAAQRPGLVSRPSSAAAATKTIVLVSGGNGGIGYEIVKKLATENPTYQILLGSRDIHKGEAAAASLGAPSNINPIQLDVTSDTSIEHCARTIEQHFGRLDVLINNAGTAAQDLPNRNENFRRAFNHCYDVNVTGAACLTEATAPLLLRSALARVIFISSGLGSIAHVLRPEEQLHPVPFYSASKAAMNYLAAYYAKKFAAQGFKVNAVCPGLNATGLNNVELADETHPRNGALRVAELIGQGAESVSGTYSNKEGPLPW